MAYLWKYSVETVVVESRLAGANGGPASIASAEKFCWLFGGDWQVIICNELLFYRQTRNLDLYNQQFDQLKKAMAQKQSVVAKRKAIIFKKDTARPETSIVTRQKLRELSWYILSPNLAPSCYYLFLSMEIEFSNENYVLREAYENRLSVRLTVFKMATIS